MRLYSAERRDEALLQALCGVWERSVRATHSFLTESEIQRIAGEVPGALRAVPRLIVAEEGGRPAAFMGMDGRKLEMLFVDPDRRGRGLGRRLVLHGIAHDSVDQVCVNVQNPQAVGFYERMGFQVFRRTETDEQGGPYPLFYMRRRGASGMQVLDQLEPKRVFHYFEELCAIPHGSRNTRAVSDWCAAFARERGLEHYQDGLGNVIIIKEASAGYEQSEPVILQGHMDMVCEKTPECRKDMEREGLDLRTDGETVWAEGTTLGGDDGIAVAMMLAVLEDESLPHPRVEAVFTVDEEVGMPGAEGLDVSPLRGRRMLNLDSEVEGVFTVSCAGGSMVTCALPVERAPFDGAMLRVTVGGLSGGHSGTEIHRGLGNSSILCGRVLLAMSRRTDLRLAAVDGGLKDNAIPRETVALAAAADPEAALAAAAELDAAFKAEYRAADPGVFVRAERVEAAETPMDAASTKRVVCLLSCAPNGVQEMSLDVAGLVQTSLNLGVLSTGPDRVKATFCVRSSLDSQKEMVKERLRCLTAALGGETSVSGDYPGWAYLPDSPLRERMLEVFREQYGKEPRVEAIHAGVECGILAGKLPGLDCVSIGPDLTDIHTPRERMHVASVRRVWNFTAEVLRRLR